MQGNVQPGRTLLLPIFGRVSTLCPSSAPHCHFIVLLCREWPPKHSRGPLPSGTTAKLQAATGANALGSGMQLPNSSKRGEGALSDSPGSQAAPEDRQDLSVEASGLSEQVKQMSKDEASGSASNSSSSSPEGARRFRLKKLPVFYFTYPEDLRHLNHGDAYLQPRFPNYPAIDAMAIVGSKVSLFQVTRSTRHKINAGLCKVLAYLPAHLDVEMIWVMPPEIWSGTTFNAETVPTLAEAGFTTEELKQIDVQLVEARLKALKTQFTMAVLHLREDEKPTDDADAEEPKEASQVQYVPVTDGSAEAGSMRSGTEGATKEQGATGDYAVGKRIAGSTRGKRRAGKASAVMGQTTVTCSIVGRHVQVHIPSGCLMCLLDCSRPVRGVFI